MEDETGTFWEWVLPLLFILCAGWLAWHTPAFILDFIPSENPSLVEQISEQHKRKDVTPNLPGVFGGYADIIDWGALILMPIFFVIGARGVKIATMEYQEVRPVDRAAMFVGRVTMMLILLMTLVMLYEVFLRYAVEKPTLWANELTLWLAGFVFLSSGFYAMQQRSHIRIFLLYEAVPRAVQRVFDTMATFLICLFAFFMVFGSYNQVFGIKFYRWEMFGTAFDPPIPATIQPMILIMVVLIACQSLLNLIADWNKEPEKHTGVVDMDADELEQIKRSVGAD